MELLPHRYPFLLVDRVLRLEPRKEIDAYKNVSINEPFFQGHFPSLPVMPGVLIIEAMAQAGGLLILADMPADDLANSIFLFTGIEKVRFRKPVHPGDRLDLHCELVRRKLRLSKMRGTARVNGALVAEAELTAAIMAREEI
jgi:3-hydroxyacyl-[acyl-carrier-protein] dehydratase